jgi:hypothetical protein
MSWVDVRSECLRDYEVKWKGGTRSAKQEWLRNSPAAMRKGFNPPPVPEATLPIIDFHPRRKSDRTPEDIRRIAQGGYKLVSPPPPPPVTEFICFEPRRSADTIVPKETGPEDRKRDSARERKRRQRERMTAKKNKTELITEDRDAHRKFSDEERKRDIRDKAKERKRRERERNAKTKLNTEAKESVVPYYVCITTYFLRRRRRRRRRRCCRRPRRRRRPKVVK